MEGRDQRRSRRILFASSAVVRYGEQMHLEAHVDTHDISLHGVFLATESRIPLDTLCDIEIRLSGTTSTMDFRARGVVQRHDPGGLGLAFTHLDPDSFLHILNLVKLHAAEEEGATPSSQLIDPHGAGNRS